MDGKVKYASLEEAVRGLLTTVDSLDDPIQSYTQQSSTIGEEGNVWNGTAAEQAKPILDKLQSDIIRLQAICKDFAEKLNISLDNYQKADNNAVSNMYNNINI